MYQTSIILIMSAYVALVESTGIHIPNFANFVRSPICREPKVKLYGTKTLYADAIKYLTNPKNHLPNAFGTETLRKENSKFLKDGCRPILLYYIGRHSARYPEDFRIEEYNKNMQELVEKLRLTNKSCKNMRHKFNEWKSRMVPEQGDLMTHFGGLEKSGIARRFKKLFPNFFDSKSADITIGVSTIARALHTASYFLREVVGINLKSCEAPPTNDINHPDYDLQKVLDAECYKELSNKFYLPALEFHTHCLEISQTSDKTKHPLIKRVNSPRAMNPIARRVAAKLGLDKISLTLLDNIWNTCRFESGLLGNSVWCTVFEPKDIEALQYVEDVSSYYKGAYGPHPKQTCPLVSDMIDKFKIAIARAESGNETPQSYFYFTNATPMKKMLATFAMFRDDENFSDRATRKFEASLKVPKKRQWKTNIESPFSANLSFLLYQCPSLKDKYKLLTTVAESPIKIGGCNDVRCSIQTFFENYNHMLDCDLHKICTQED